MVRRRIPPNPKHMWRPPSSPSAEQASTGAPVTSGDSGVSGPRKSQRVGNVDITRAPAPFFSLYAPPRNHSPQLNPYNGHSQSIKINLPSLPSSLNSSLNSSSNSSSNSLSNSTFLPLKISTLKDFIPMLPFITAYGPKTRVVLSFPEQPFGRTKQAFRQESDINNIVAQFLKTGTLEFTRKHEPQYGDVTGADFQAAMNTITAANSMFADLPAKLRSRFENDPAQFLDFVQDDNNREEAAQLGLLKPTASGATPPAPVGAKAAEQPQNRTQDGRFTFDNAPAGPKGDGKTNSNT